jgi:hypothetical protein
MVEVGEHCEAVQKLSGSRVGVGRLLDAEEASKIAE